MVNLGWHEQLNTIGILNLYDRSKVEHFTFTRIYEFMSALRLNTHYYDISLPGKKMYVCVHRKLIQLF